MAIAIESSSSEAQGRLTSHTVTLPSGIASGDVLFIQYATEIGGDAVTWPANWDLIDTYSAANPRIEKRYFKAAGGETSISVSTVSSSKASWVVYRISGAADPDITAPDVNTVTTATSTDPDPGSLTPAGGSKEYLWIATVAARSSNACTAGPSGYSNFLSEVITPGLGDTSVAAATKISTASSEDPGVFTCANTAWVAHTVAFSPAEVPIDISPPAAQLQLSATALSIDFSFDITIPAAQLELSTIAPSLSFGDGIVPPAAQLQLSTSVPVLTISSIIVEAITLTDAVSFDYIRWTELEPDASIWSPVDTLVDSIWTPVYKNL